MKLKDLFVISKSVLILLIVLIGIISFLMLDNQDQIVNSQDVRFKSFQIAIELKQSSDDLTRYCRNYVSTGDILWENKYWEVLEIRNGNQSRPDGKTIALVDSMKKLGFTDEEFNLLKEAEKNSNKLVYTEKVAFNAMKGLYDDGTGNFTIKGQPDQQMAVRIMYDEKYHQDKASIMKPIDEFIELLNSRTASELEYWNMRGHNELISILVIIVISIIISLASLFIVREKIIKKMDELEKAYEVIEENEERLRLFMDGIPGAAYIKDQNLRMLFTSKGYNSESNIDPSEIINKKPSEYYPADFARKVEEDDRRVLNSGKAEIIEYKLNDKYWLMHKFLISRSGEPPLLAGIAIDVTEKIHAEELSRKLSRAVEQSPVSIMITDISGNIEYVNPKFTEISGYSSEEVLGSNPRMLKSDSLSSDEYKNLWETISKGSVWQGEFCNLKKNGDQFWESASISPIFNYQGNITHFIAVKEDITEKKKIQETVEYERKFLRTIIDNIPDLIYVKNTKAQKTLSNKADLSLMRLTSEAEAIGKDDFAFYPEQVAKGFYSEDMQVIQNAKPAINTEEWYSDNLGKRRYYTTNKYPLFDEENNVIGLVGIGRDITDRKLRELDLEKHLRVQTNLANLFKLVTDDVNEFLGVTLEAAIQITESQGGCIYEFSDNTKNFKLIACSNNGLDAEPAESFNLENSGLLKDVIDSCNELVINECKLDDIQAIKVPGCNPKINRFLAIPVVRSNQIVAVLGLSNKETEYNTSDVNNLTLLMGWVTEKVISIEAEKKLIESEHRHRVLFSESPDAYMILKDGIFTDCNSTTEKILLTTRENIIGKSPIEFSPEYQPDGSKSSESGKQKIEDAYKNGSANYEWVHNRSDGSHFYAAISIVKIKLDGEDALLSTLRDITSRKLAELNLELADKGLRMAQSIGNIGNWDFDLITNIPSVSDQIGKILGIDVKEKGNNNREIFKAVISNLQPIIDKAINVLVELGNEYDEELHFDHPDGTQRWIHSKAELEKDSDGKAQRITGIIQDITEQKLIEEKLRDDEQKLSEFIATKDKFFSIISHDLRSPFSALLGFSEMLLTEYDTMSDEEKIGFIESINEVSRNSFKLLENLLEWSHIQTGKISFTPEMFNVLVVLHPTLKLFKETAKNKNIKLEYDIDNIVEIVADKYMIDTTVRNLISNAIKFTKPGGNIMLSIKADQESLLISVKDSGVGISEKNLGKLFKIESNVSTEGTAKEKGTGLGLLLCKEMVEKHGGKIWAESEEGKGTKFSFTIPLA